MDPVEPAPGESPRKPDARASGRVPLPAPGETAPPAGRGAPLVTLGSLVAIPDGGTLRLGPDARVTLLAEEEACRRGIRLSRGSRRGDAAPPANLASLIDHTLLRPDATVADIDRLCAEALEHGFASVCVNGGRVARCAELLAGSPVLVCAVAGFPLGAMATDVKVFEATRALDEGAREVDVVLAIGALKGGDADHVQRDVAAVAQTCHARGGRLKVILETCLLDDAEKVRACELAVAGGADFVKTSTGFSRSGATVADVTLMRHVVGPTVGVKASGGVRDRAEAMRLLDAGANRLGTSSSVAIVSG